MKWTVAIDSAPEVTFEALGIGEDLRVITQSQAQDFITFSIPTPDAASVAPFAYKTRLRFYCQPDDADAGSKFKWFEGWIVTKPVVASENSHRVIYTASGPWWWLTQSVFQQAWYGAVDPANPASSLVLGWKTRLILNQGFNGAKLNTNQQILAVLDWIDDTATNQGVASPMQADPDGYPAVNIAISEERNLLCSEVIQTQMKWIPDGVLWFDYEQSPPMLKINRRGDLPVRTLDFKSPFVSGVTLTPRNDLQVPVVVFKYEQTNSTNGTEWLATAFDVFPAPAGGGPPYTIAQVNAAERKFGALVQTLDLAGYQVSYARSTLKTATWNGGNSAWLKAHLSWLQGSNLSAISGFAEKLVYEDGQEYDFATNTGPVPTFTKELVSGSIVPGFMHNGQAIVGARYTLVGKVSYTANDGTGETGKVKDQPYSIQFLATNAVDGNYSAITSYQEGDPVPAGLAQTIYEGLSELQYEGTIQLRAEDPNLEVTVGTVVNIVNGQAGWATMKALVQSVAVDVFRGTKTITVGVAKHLTSGDLLALLRVTRTRRVWASPQMLDTGKVGSQVTDFPSKAAVQDSSVGGSGQAKLLVSAPVFTGPTQTAGFIVGVLDSTTGVFRFEAKQSEPGTGVLQGQKVIIDLAQLTDGNGGILDLAVREMDVCIDDETWKVKGLFTAPYQ